MKINKTLSNIPPAHSCVDCKYIIETFEVCTNHCIKVTGLRSTAAFYKTCDLMEVEDESTD